MRTVLLLLSLLTGEPLEATEVRRTTTTATTIGPTA